MTNRNETKTKPTQGGFVQNVKFLFVKNKKALPEIGSAFLYISINQCIRTNLH